MKSVKCKSGITGWQGKLQEAYENYQEFVIYAKTYGVHTRIGFRSMKRCWAENPTVQGSVIPSDYCRVK